MIDKNLFTIGGLYNYLNAESFGVVLDNVNAKYNDAIWRRYADWGVPSNEREWKQGVKKTPILVRASVLGTHSEKPQRSTQGWEIYGGTLPKIGHGFSITEDEMIELRRIAKLNDLTFGESLIDAFINNSGNMLGGVHNELSYMTLQALSTGGIHDVAIDGFRYDFDFQIPDANYTAPASGSEWFNTNGTPNTSADPIEDFMTFQTYFADTLSLGVDHWKISKTLLDNILKHPSVTAAYKAGKNFYNPQDVKVVKSDLLAWMHDEMGIWPFDVIDFKTRHEEDGKPVNDAPAFDIHNMAACSRSYKPFEMKCMRSILADRASLGAHNDSVRTTLVEGRIAVQDVWHDRPMMNIVDCELYAGPVFNNVNDYGIVTVWSES